MSSTAKDLKAVLRIAFSGAAEQLALTKAVEFGLIQFMKRINRKNTGNWWRPVG